MHFINIFFIIVIIKKGANSHKGRHTRGDRRDRSQGPVPATKSHRVNRHPVAGTEFLLV